VFLASFLVDGLGGRGWDRVTLAAEETVLLALLLVDGLGGLGWEGVALAAEETVPFAGLLRDWLVLNRGWLLVAREEGHVDGACWI